MDIQVIPSQDIFQTISRVIFQLNSSLDCYYDAKNLPLIVKILSTNGQKMMELKSKKGRLRCVTEITHENLSYCKELMKNFELFHTSCLTGSFLIADEQEYAGYLMDRKGTEKLLRITNPSFVESQKFLFNTMVDKALPARQRIIEIKRGAGGEFMETIRDSLRIKSITLDLVRSAIYEIAILFSTRNSFFIAEREGILEEISQVSGQGVKVKILVMQDEAVKEISNAKLKVADQNIQVNYLQQLLPTKITTLIVDQTKSLTVEVNDDTKEDFQEAIGLATYSNSESTVFSNVSMFESLWIQSELDKQNKARQTYFQMFKGFKLKDEIYSRRWSFDNKKE
jgi:two-component system, OmpR family, sensor histidine kinase VicK